MNLITLLTDFSDRDGYVGVMKGVIVGIAPHACVVDINHSIAPYNMRQSANIRAQNLEKSPITRIIIWNMEINGIRKTLSECALGELPAMMASFAYLSAGVANGSAAKALDADVGETIRVAFLPI